MQQGHMVSHDHVQPEKTCHKKPPPIPDISVEDIQNIVGLFENPSEDSIRISGGFHTSMVESRDTEIVEKAVSATLSTCTEEPTHPTCLFGCGAQDLHELNEDLDVLRQDFETTATDFKRAVTFNKPLTSRELKERRGSLVLKRHWRGKMSPEWADE